MTRPIHALVGGDLFMQLQTLEAIASKLPPDTQRMEYDGEKAELADVLDELRSFALFGSAKLVVVRDADDFVSRFRDQMEKYAESPSSSGVLVLRMSSLPKNQKIAKLIAKNGEIHECVAPNEYKLPAWITARARDAYKLAITPRAATLLADLIGNNLMRLDSELSKLAITATGGKIDEHDIAGSIAFQRQQQIWELTNALADGDNLEALRRWRHLTQFDSTAEFRAVTWLTMWLEDVRNVQSGNTGGLQRKYWDRLPTFLRTAEQFGPQRTARAVDLLAELDKRSKSGLGEMSTNVEQFILSLAGP
ncbi:MAG: DNA polymerase III subunit delta [Tepidisphaeraceae bacterium]